MGINHDYLTDSGSDKGSKSDSPSRVEITIKSRKKRGSGYGETWREHKKTKGRALGGTISVIVHIHLKLINSKRWVRC